MMQEVMAGRVLLLASDNRTKTEHTNNYLAMALFLAIK